MKCPKCNDLEKEDGKTYCKPCYASYIRERRAANKLTIPEKFMLTEEERNELYPENKGGDSTSVAMIKPEITWYEKLRMEHEEWKKGKCIFCFQPSKTYHRRNGAVELCVTHACV